ncbi:TIGR02301 family protein [Methylobacterium sp. A49B]
MRRPASILCLLALLAGAVPTPAPAQQRAGRPAARDTAKEATKEAPKEANAPADVPAPYDRDLMRMSEIIGALAFLRGLCGTPDAADWPARMKALIESEGVTPARRDRLAGAYNRGYRGYALTYRVCTPAAHEAAARYVAEGDRLSHALAGRFGG